MPSDLYRRIYDVVRCIPSGRVCTYGAIAEFLGSKGAARVVGYAMNAAHQYRDVPAHRVVNRNGILTGKHHFQDALAMQRYLEEEGLEVLNDRVVDFEKHFWNPCEYLRRSDFL